MVVCVRVGFLPHSRLHRYLALPFLTLFYPIIPFPACRVHGRETIQWFRLLGREIMAQGSRSRSEGAMVKMRVEGLRLMVKPDFSSLCASWKNFLI